MRLLIGMKPKAYSKGTFAIVILERLMNRGFISEKPLSQSIEMERFAVMLLEAPLQ